MTMMTEHVLHSMMMEQQRQEQGADATSASGSTSLPSCCSTNQPQQYDHSPAAAAVVALPEYDWEHDWAEVDGDDGDDENDEYKWRSAPSSPSRYFYPYASTNRAAVSGGSGNDWASPPVFVFMAQMASLVLFSSLHSSSPSLKEEGTSTLTPPATTTTHQPTTLFWPLLCFNALVVVLTAWLYYVDRQQQEQHNNKIAQKHQLQYLLLCMPEMLMTFTSLLFYLDCATMACCTLVLCALGSSLLVLQVLLNQLSVPIVDYASPSMAKQTTTRRTARVPRVIQFEKVTTDSHANH
jgi:hypothetical protein